MESRATATCQGSFMGRFLKSNVRWQVSYLTHPRLLSTAGLLFNVLLSCATDTNTQTIDNNRQATEVGSLGGNSIVSSSKEAPATQTGFGGTTNKRSETGTGGTTITTTKAAYFDGLSRLNGLPVTRCIVTITKAELSPQIATVGVVSFSTNLARVVSAEIHFGKNSDYNLVAPVDLKEDSYRTLLLGMIQNHVYHFRVAVSDGTSVCYGEDQTLETGTLNSKALAEASTSDGAAPGFIVTARDGEAVIYDKKGELVWSYKIWNVFSVQMSWDGKYLLARDPGPFDLSNGGLFYRVKMDGSDFMSLDATGGDHHDFTAIPTGIAYLAKMNEGECDRVYEASIDVIDGVPRFDTWQIYQYFPDQGFVEGTEICHANRIHYSFEKDWYTVSDRNKDALAVFTRTGSPITSIGTTPKGEWVQHIQAESAGLGGSWHVQHGHHVYADNKFVVFSNDAEGGASVLHYTITGNRATLDWKYSGAGDSKIQGDVQHLPNGNFLVTANLSNTMIEIGPDGRTEVGRYVLNGPIGPLYGFTYASHRPTLYGAPAPR